MANARWNLRSTGQPVEVSLPAAGICCNVGSYSVSENRMLLIKANLSYRLLGVSGTSSGMTGTQSFAAFVSSDFLRKGGTKYLDPRKTQFSSSNPDMQNFQIKLGVKTEGDNHQLQIFKDQAPDFSAEGVFYIPSNSISVEISEIDMKDQKASIATSRIADGTATSGKIESTL